jgi:hypothetical protein
MRTLKVFVISTGARYEYFENLEISGTTIRPKKENKRATIHNTM